MFRAVWPVFTKLRHERYAVWCNVSDEVFSTCLTNTADTWTSDTDCMILKWCLVTSSKACNFYWGIYRMENNNIGAKQFPIPPFSLLAVTLNHWGKTFEICCVLLLWSIDFKSSFVNMATVRNFEVTRGRLNADKICTWMKGRSQEWNRHIDRNRCVAH